MLLLSIIIQVSNVRESPKLQLSLYLKHKIKSSAIYITTLLYIVDCFLYKNIISISKRIKEAMNICKGGKKFNYIRKRLHSGC